MRFLLFFVLLFSFGTAHAQNYIRIPTCGTASPAPGAGNAYMDQFGNICTAGGGGAAAVTITPTTGTPVESSVTCGTSSTTLLAASTATTFIFYQNPITAAGPVCFNAAGAAAVIGAGSICPGAGATQTWSTVQGYVPTSAISCIAAASTAVTLIYK